MLSPFIFQERPLHLERYPVNQINRSLQAWDSADELIITHLKENELLANKPKILILNDSFGALATNLSNQNIILENDSFVSRKGIEHNLSLNELNNETIAFKTPLEPITTAPDIVLIKIPKNLSLLEQQLHNLAEVMNDSTTLIGAARVKDLPKSVFKLFESIIGSVTTSLAQKKSRLLFCSFERTQRVHKQLSANWHIDQLNLSMTNLANVFSRESMDIGARLFIKHLPEFKDNQKVLDLGCGNGIVGLASLRQNENIQCHFVDESYLAVESAKLNVSNNFNSTVLTGSEFIVSDCLSECMDRQIDTILCNPPFHQEHAVTDHIAWQMFNDSFKTLNSGGELRIVGNRQLGYHIKLKRIFGNCKTIASDKKFVILSSIKK